MVKSKEGKLRVTIGRGGSIGHTLHRDLDYQEFSVHNQAFRYLSPEWLRALRQRRTFQVFQLARLNDAYDFGQSVIVVKEG